MSERTDIELLRQKFEELFIHYFPRVKNFASKLLKSDFEAEDIAQDIFVKLWETPHLWANAPDSVDNLLFTIARNRVFDHIKHQKVERAYRDKTADHDILGDILSAGTPIDDLYYKEIRLLLLLRLEQMPPKRKQVFEMNRFEGLSNEEIADRLNLSVRTVEHHIYLALADLKKTLLTLIFFIYF